MSMMGWDKSKAIQTILNRKRSSGGGEVLSGPTEMKNEEVQADDGQPDMKHLAAEEVMHAFHSKSAQNLRESLENFINLHMSHKSDNDKPDPNEA